MEIKRKLKSLENKTGLKIKSRIKNIIGDHDRYKSCYFWSNTGNAANRRRQEFTTSLKFNLNEIEYDICQDLSISCKNFYYSCDIQKNGKKSNIKSLKNLV